MATRRIVERLTKSIDGEWLQVVVIHQVGVNKEQVRKENPYCKHHKVLVSNGNTFEYIEKRA